MSEKKELWLKLLKKLSSETYNIYLGTGNHLDMETAPARVRAFGGCSAHFARCNNLPYINGCPPSYEEVITLFELN